MGITDFQVFYFPRVLCTFGIIWYSSTNALALLSTPSASSPFFPLFPSSNSTNYSSLFSSNRTLELYTEWEKNQIFNSFSSIFPVCTDLLFVLSGFFVTMKLIMMLEAEKPLSSWRLFVYRVLRFFPMLICLFLFAFFTHDPVYWKTASFDWKRAFSLFGWQNFANEEWLDFSTFPAWVLSVEMHGAFVLCALIPMLYRLDQKPTTQLWMFVLAIINVRGFVLASTDPDCLLRECIGSLSSVLSAAGKTFADNLKERGWVGAREENNACPRLCEGATAAEQFSAYLPNVLLPSYMNLIPFLLGSILFFEYISAYQRVNDKNKRSWAAWSSLLIGPSLVWLLYVHKALPEDFSFILGLLLPSAFREAFWPLLYAGSWCGIMFSALVPVAHPAKSFPTTRLLSLPLLATPARFSFGLCLFHWPVLSLLVRHVALPIFDHPLLAAIEIFALVLICTTPFAVGFHVLGDRVWCSYLHLTVLDNLPRISSLENRPDTCGKTKSE